MEHDLIEITGPLELSEENRLLVDLHSFVNIANILEKAVSLLRSDFGNGDFDLISQEVSAFQEALRSSGSEWHRFADTLKFGELFDGEFQKASSRNPDVAALPEINARAKNIRSLLTVLATRSDEYLLRDQSGIRWEPHSCIGLRQDLEVFFAAVGKNSEGRFGITTNVARRQPGDYLIALGIEGVHGDEILMPALVKDVFRDLIANARKYTPTGGNIAAGLWNNGEELSLVVEDNGRGIPEDELSRVVEFGYRAGNVSDKVTYGSGFGLTKAYQFVRSTNGRFLIGSRIMEGTRIEIRIPLPATVCS